MMNRCFKTMATFCGLSSVVQLLLLATAMGRFSVAHGAIVINEGMINPLATKPGQWVELYNTDATEVDLSDWIIVVFDPFLPFPDFRFQWQLLAGTVIPGNGYFVFGDERTTGQPYVDFILVGVTNGFNVDGTAADQDGVNGVAIFSSTGTLQDALLWDTSGENGPDLDLPFQVAPGASLMRKNATSLALDPNNWTPSTTLLDCRDDENKATPKRSNDYICPTKPPTVPPTMPPTILPTMAPTMQPTMPPTTPPIERPIGPAPTAPMAPTAPTAPMAPTVCPGGDCDCLAHCPRAKCAEMNCPKKQNGIRKCIPQFNKCPDGQTCNKAGECVETKCTKCEQWRCFCDTTCTASLKAGAPTCNYSTPYVCKKSGETCHLKDGKCRATCGKSTCKAGQVCRSKGGVHECIAQATSS